MGKIVESLLAELPKILSEAKNVSAIHIWEKDLSADEKELLAFCRKGNLRALIVVVENEAFYDSPFHCLLERVLPGRVIAIRNSPIDLIEIRKSINKISDNIENPFSFIPNFIKEMNTDPEYFFHVKDNYKLKISELFEYCGKNVVGSARKSQREIAFHSHEDDIKLKKIKIYDLATAVILRNSILKNQSNFNVLWVENKPDIYEKDMAVVLKCMKGFNLFLIKDGFNSTYEKLIAETPSLPVVKYPREETNNISLDMKIDEFDMILLDIFLGEKSLNGLDIQRRIKEIRPGAVVIMLSQSRDYENIKTAYAQKSESYLLKDQLLSWPFLYFQIIEDVGPIILRIKNADLRKHVLNLIRGWKYNRDYLWFGDKCYHMINHSYKHILDDWILFNQITEILHKYRADAFPRLSDEDIDEDIYVFTLAVWLHDIGHRGDEELMEPAQIRNNHGYLSGEFILRHPDILGIREFDKSSGLSAPDNYYKTKYREYDEFSKTAKNETKLPSGNVNLLEEIIKRNGVKKRKFTIAEKAALVAMFHKSNTPIYESEQEHPDLPEQYKCRNTSRKYEITSCERMINGWEEDLKKKFLGLVALFRLVDGLDIHKTRVGSRYEERLKKSVIQQDFICALKKLEAEIKTISDIRQKKKCEKPLQATMNRRNYDKNELENPVKAYNKIKEKYPNYFTRLNYAQFISVQDGHFDLHGCVDSIEIKWNNTKKRIRFVYKLNRPLSWLLSQKVKEKDKKGIAIFEKLIGKKNTSLPYPLAELSSGIGVLGKWLNLEKGIEFVLEVPSLSKEIRKYKRDLAAFENTDNEIMSIIDEEEIKKIEKKKVAKKQQ